MVGDSSTICILIEKIVVDTTIQMKINSIIALDLWIWIINIVEKKKKKICLIIAIDIYRLVKFFGEYLFNIDRKKKNKKFLKIVRVLNKK